MKVNALCPLYNITESDHPLVHTNSTLDIARNIVKSTILDFSLQQISLTSMCYDYKSDLSKEEFLVVGHDLYQQIQLDANYKAPTLTLVVKDVESNIKYESVPTAIDDFEHTLKKLHRHIFIDRVEFIFKTHKQKLSKFVKDVKANKCEGISCKVIPIPDPTIVGFKKLMIITDNNTDASLQFLSEPVFTKSCKCKIVTKPTDINIALLKVILNELASKRRKAFEKMIKTARITRVDFTFDNTGLQVCQLLFLVKNSQRSKLFVDQFENMETNHVGTTGFFAKAYDKLKEQADSDALPELSEQEAPARFEGSVIPSNTNLSPIFEELCQEIDPFNSVLFFNYNKVKRHLSKPEFKYVKKYGLFNLMKTIKAADNARHTRLKRLLDKCKNPVSKKTTKKARLLLTEMMNELLSTRN
jgi:hypothetical protein